MSSSTKRIGLWAAAAAAIIGVFGLLIWVGGSLSDIDPINDRDWVRGNRNAPVVLTEYGDFQCPSCAAVYPYIKQAEKEFGDDLAVVFRQLPLSEIHNNALPAAWAAEAAGKQGKFFEMHDILYERQKFWENEENPQEKFASYAVDVLGLNKEQFLTDYQSADVRNKVEDARKEAEKNGINSTPTLFVNGKYVRTFVKSYEELKPFISEALEKERK